MVIASPVPGYKDNTPQIVSTDNPPDQKDDPVHREVETQVSYSAGNFLHYHKL
jgi:hypothetical protein